jgi:hypothetical protein
VFSKWRSGFWYVLQLIWMSEELFSLRAEVHILFFHIVNTALHTGIRDKFWNLHRDRTWIRWTLYVAEVRKGERDRRRKCSLYKTFRSAWALGTRLLSFFSPGLDGVRGGVLRVLPHWAKKVRCQMRSSGSASLLRFWPWSLPIFILMLGHVRAHPLWESRRSKCPPYNHLGLRRLEALVRPMSFFSPGLDGVRGRVLGVLPIEPRKPAARWGLRGPLACSDFCHKASLFSSWCWYIMALKSLIWFIQFLLFPLGIECLSTSQVTNPQNMRSAKVTLSKTNSEKCRR